MHSIHPSPSRAAIPLECHIYPQIAFWLRISRIQRPTLPRMKRFLICVMFLTTFTATASATDCIEKACIEVYTQNGTIVIEGRKGTGPVEKKSVSPAPSKPRIPIVRKTVRPKPKPVVTAQAKPKIVTSTKKPVVKKRVRTDSSSPATSLSDKLVEILPTAGIAYSPSFSPLIKKRQFSSGQISRFL